MQAVAYSRVSTDEQNPENQRIVIENYANEKGYTIVKYFEDAISGAVPPEQRPAFRKMLEFCEKKGIKVILMYDLTRFYRAPSPTEALSKLKELYKKGYFVDFAREPQIDDPMLRELWDFIKSWFASYERLQISTRTKYGLMRKKAEGKLFHRPTLLHYFTATLFNKELDEITKEDLEKAKPQLLAIISKYWYDSRFKRRKIAEILIDYETIFKKLYQRFPNAPKSYYAFYYFIRKC